jgi:hypothetical protein
MAYPYTSNDPNFIGQIYKDLTDPDYWRGFREYWTQPDTARDEQFFRENPGLRPVEGTPSIPKQLEKSAQGAQQTMAKAGQQFGSEMMEINPNPYGYNKYLGRFAEGFKSPVESLFGSSLVPQEPKKNFFGGQFDVTSALKSGELSQSPITNPSAQNTAQRSNQYSEALEAARKSVDEAIGRSGKMEKMGGFTPEEGRRYSTERDVAGNIISVTPLAQVKEDPLVTAMQKGYKAKGYEGGAGNPFTPNLDKFKARQDPNVLSQTMAGMNPSDVAQSQYAQRGVSGMGQSQIAGIKTQSEIPIPSRSKELGSIKGSAPQIEKADLTSFNKKWKQEENKMMDYYKKNPSAASADVAKIKNKNPNEPTT